MTDQHYVNEMTDTRKLHEIETVETRTIINEMMPMFYDCIVEVYLAGNLYTTLPAVTIEKGSLYFDEDTVGGPRTDLRGVNIHRERIET